MFLTRISISQPVFATMIMVAIMVFGIVGWKSLPIDKFPDVDFPVVAVLTTYSGASPETVESEVTKTIEDALNTISGIDTISSTSSLGHSTIIIRFTLETDSKLAAQDVRDKLSTVEADLPDGIDEPEIIRHNPTSEPIMSLAVSSTDMSKAALSSLIDDLIVPTLTTVDGVGSADVVGSVDDQVSVELDPDRLRSFGLGISEVTSALQKDNLLLPAGSISKGANKQNVQIDSEVDTVDDLAKIIIARQSNAPVHLGDIATIKQNSSEPDSLAFHDGTSALTIDIEKVEGSNTVAIANDLKAVIDELMNNGVLGNARIDILTNSADAIEANYETVKSTLIEGTVLAVAIVFLFLNSWRSTVITALTLPISFLGTLAALSLFGFTLNMMTMLALTLSIGILIDDAIVVRENITRHLHMGKDHRTAALDGTGEIGLAVLATTFALCSVFLPLAFMTGIAGRFFLQFGLTVAVAVLISLFVSFTLDPMLSSVWYDPDAEPNAKRGPVGRAIARFEKGFEKTAKIYRSFLMVCLHWRKTTLLVAGLTLAVSVFLVPILHFEFLPKGDESRISIDLETAEGASRDYTALKAGQVSSLLRALPEVTEVYTTVAAGTNAQDNDATIMVNLVDPADRSLSADAMVPNLRKYLQQVPGVDLTIAAVGGIGNQAPVEIKLFGLDADKLQEGAQIVSDLVSSVPGTADVSLSTKAAQPMLNYVLLRDVASDLGVSSQAAGSALRTLIDGTDVSDFKLPDGTTNDIVVRLPEKLREDPGYLDQLPIVNNGKQIVTLGEIARLERTDSPSQIDREAHGRVVTISSELEGRTLGDVMRDIKAKLAEIQLPVGVRAAFDGDAKYMNETMASMGMSILLAIVFIYLVLASQFASFLQPFAIMAALPLSLVGVVGGLIAWHSTMNLYSMIGLVMLMGLVVKNSILLVDNANHHIRAGMSLNEALLEAGATRFRPIIMTTLAMIFGMLPLALAIHPGSEQNASMAQAVIGGLISSTLLTLVVVPVVVTYLDQITAFCLSMVSSDKKACRIERNA